MPNLVSAQSNGEKSACDRCKVDVDCRVYFGASVVEGDFGPSGMAHVGIHVQLCRECHVEATAFFVKESDTFFSKVKEFVTSKPKEEITEG